MLILMFSYAIYFVTVIWIRYSEYLTFCLFLKLFVVPGEPYPIENFTVPVPAPVPAAPVETDAGWGSLHNTYAENNSVETMNYLATECFLHKMNFI